MSVTYTDPVRPAAARPAERVDSEAYVPVYARNSARTSNKPVKTWMILAPLGVLMVGGAAAAMLMSPAETTLPEAAAPLAPPTVTPAVTSELSPLTAATVPMETPTDLATAPLPPSDLAPAAPRAAPAPVARTSAARTAPARTSLARTAPAAPSTPAAEAPVPAGPQPYLSVAPQAGPTTMTPAAPTTTPAASPPPIVITPTA
ncbi:MAG: hypothetical protein P0Y52_01560 [Candidatus Brevundimonas phytovorans]|nr:hypothetical protein [Brevundimonas sp.]WEK58249.1 MAG: hypothetical protein P0Y52_01560 [Brevundimonas sp.]